MDKHITIFTVNAGGTLGAEESPEQVLNHTAKIAQQ